MTDFWHYLLNSLKLHLVSVQMVLPSRHKGQSDLKSQQHFLLLKKSHSMALKHPASMNQTLG